MNTNPENKLLLKDEVYQIVGSAIEVLNEIGHGLHEKTYENALVIELGIRKILFRQQANFDVLYKGHLRSDCLSQTCWRTNRSVVDAKVIDRITDVERGQMLNYLKITKYRVGVILNFKNPKLEWERLIL